MRRSILDYVIFLAKAVRTIAAQWTQVSAACSCILMICTKTQKKSCSHTSACNPCKVSVYHMIMLGKTIPIASSFTVLILLKQALKDHLPAPPNRIPKKQLHQPLVCNLFHTSLVCLPLSIPVVDCGVQSWRSRMQLHPGPWKAANLWSIPQPEGWEGVEWDRKEWVHTKWKQTQLQKERISQEYWQIGCLKGVLGRTSDRGEWSSLPRMEESRSALRQQLLLKGPRVHQRRNEAYLASTFVPLIPSLLDLRPDQSSSEGLTWCHRTT